MSHKYNHSTNDMLHFVIRIANVNIGINALSTGTYGYCIRYLTSEQPDISVSVTKDDVARMVASQHSSISVNEPYLETLAIYSKIVDEMVHFNCFLMHGAVIAIGDNAWMFSAKSGTGKTTLIKQWLKTVPGSYVVNGDKPLIWLANKQAYACGTPWCGKERMGANVIVPLKGIAFLERSESNSIHRISFSQAYPFLLQNVHMSLQAQNAKSTLQLLQQLGDIPRYYHFKINNFADDCVKVSYDAMTGKI